MRWFFFVFSFFIFQFQAQAAENPTAFVGNVGRAAFSLTSPSFACSAFLNSLKGLPAAHVAFIYNTFGNDFRCFNRLTKNKALQTLEVNLINEPGLRNHRLGSYEFLHGLTIPEYDNLLKQKDEKLHQKFLKYVASLQPRIRNLPGQVSCLINPGLESNVSDDAGATLIEWSREAFPRCRVVWNPLAASMHSVGDAGGDLTEGHGKLPPIAKACLVNLDGTDIDFPSRPSRATDGNFIMSGNPLMQYISTYANKCEVVFLWVAEDNCNYSSSFIDPRRRDCSKAARVMPLVSAEARIAMKKIRILAPYPWTAAEKKSLNACTFVRKAADGAKKGFLLKQAENRARGGVVLLPKGTKISAVQILSLGRVIDNYTDGGAYTEDGSNRPLWRSNKSPINYPDHVVVKIKNGKSSTCYQIDDPQTRID